MTIGKTYSSWTRNRLGPDAREAIRLAGDGRVDFGPAVGKPWGWVACTITTDGAVRAAVGPNPLAAFQAALAAPQKIVGLFDAG